MMFVLILSLVTVLMGSTLALRAQDGAAGKPPGGRPAGPRRRLGRRKPCETGIVDKVKEA